MGKEKHYYSDWRAITKQRIVDSLGGKCLICGYNKCNWSLVPHHVDPLQKKFSLSGNRMNKKNWPKLVNELKKCVLVCSNCHGEIHSGLVKCPKPFFDLSFEKWKYKKEEMTPCIICGKDTPKNRKTCSAKCARKRQEKIIWPKNLFELVNQTNINQTAIKLGVSYTAVKKRLKNHSFD